MQNGDSIAIKKTLVDCLWVPQPTLSPEPATRSNADSVYEQAQGGDDQAPSLVWR